MISIRKYASAFIPAALAMSSQCFALDNTFQSSAEDLPQGKFSLLVLDHLPVKIKELGRDYRISGVVESSPYRDGDRLFFYSIMLHKKVIAKDSGKAYWATTGGVREHGVLPKGETLASHLEALLGKASNSFALDQ